MASVTKLVLSSFSLHLGLDSIRILVCRLVRYTYGLSPARSVLRLMSDSLVEQADKILELANSDETDVNELSNNVSAIEGTVTKLTRLPAKRGIHKISNTTPGNTKYHIPCSFDTFNSIIDHYYNDVEPLEISGCGTTWRKYLTNSERNLF